MKNYNMSMVVIENEQDAANFYLAAGIEPDVGDIVVNGCFNGEHCSRFIVKKKGGQSYIEATSEKVQTKVNDSTLFEKKK